MFRNVKRFGKSYFKAYAQAHQDALQKSWQNLLNTPFANSITILAISICLTLPLILFMGAKNIEQLKHKWQDGAVLSLYLQPQVQQHDVEEVVREIKETPYVKSIKIIDPNTGLREFQEASQINGILELLPENPIPYVINVVLNSNQVDKNELISLKEKMSHLPGVNEVSFDLDWIEKLNQIFNTLKKVSLFLYVIIGSGVILMVGNTIRLSLERHRNEIEVLHLIGATNSFIQRPFLYRGILFGGISGIIAVCIMGLCSLLLSSSFEKIALLYEGIFVLRGLSLGDIIVILGASTALGWLGAIFAFIQQKHNLIHQDID